MKTLNIKGNGEIICHWSDNQIVTDTSDPNIPSDTMTEINALMAEIQAQGFQEIHFEYGGGRNYTHKAGSNSVEAIPNTENNLFTTMETWAANLLDE